MARFTLAGLEAVIPVNVALAIRQRLVLLKLDQRDLAVAAQVTESYISQLLTGKKEPPDPDRTEIYEKMGQALKLPNGELAKLADMQRKEGLKRKLGDPPAPLFPQVRELILHKCSPNTQSQVRAIFEKQPFGELERLVTQKLLGVVQGAAKAELENENWLRVVGRLSNRSYEQIRAILLEFLDADVFHLSAEHCVSFLDPLIESWYFDLATFGMDIFLNRRMVPGEPKKFEFVERKSNSVSEQELGLKEFLHNSSLSGDATKEEMEFLKTLQFRGKRPTPLYYYRELQNLRDPLHFRTIPIK